MELIKKAIKASLVLSVVSSSVYAQNLDEAKKAIDAEKYQQAKTILKSLVAAKPADAANYFFLGNVYLKTDYADSAKAFFSKGVAADKEFALNYVGLGAVDLDADNSASAKTNFDKAISLASRKDNDPYIYVAKAYISAPKPEFETAIAHLEKAKAMDEKDAEVFLALGDAYRGLKKNGEAYSAYRSAFDLDKTLLRSKLELGVLNKNSKAFKESTDEFNSIIAINPNYGPAYRELAETNLQWSFNVPAAEKPAKLQAAIAHYKKYLDLTDKSVDSRMRYADFLVYASDYKALEQEAQAMIQQDKANPRIYRYLGISAYENGNYQASAQALKDFISKVEPRRVIALDHFYLGKAQYKLGDSTAYANLGKGIALDSTLAEEITPLAAEAFKAKKYPEAAKLYELAILGPKATLSDHFYVGYSYYFDYAAKTQNKENPSSELLVKADSAFSYVNTKAPTYALAYIYRARTNRLLDDQKSPKGLSIPHYEKFIAALAEKPENLTDPKNKDQLTEAYNNIGAFYLTSDPAKAKEYFNKTLALDPANTYASEVIKSLNGSK